MARLCFSFTGELPNDSWGDFKSEDHMQQALYTEGVVSKLSHIHPTSVWQIPCRRTLSEADKLSYIAAVKCLHSKPPTTASDFDGVRSRYDDFLATHINNTDYIHFVVGG